MKTYKAPPGFVLNPDYLVPDLEAQRDALLEALKMWLHLHDTPAGYVGKYGKALDAAIAAQQVKIDAAANTARAAIAAVEQGEKT